MKFLKKGKSRFPLRSNRHGDINLGNETRVQFVKMRSWSSRVYLRVIDQWESLRIVDSIIEWFSILEPLHSTVCVFFKLKLNAINQDSVNFSLSTEIRMKMFFFQLIFDFPEKENPEKNLTFSLQRDFRVPVFFFFSVWLVFICDSFVISQRFAERCMKINENGWSSISR